MIAYHNTIIILIMINKYNIFFWFLGSKMFVLDVSNHSLNTIDVSQTTSMLKYIEKKEFD